MPSIRRHLLCLIALTALVTATLGHADSTYTISGSTNFTNPLAWNFGAGPFGTWGIPASDAALTLNIQTLGNSAQTVTNDLNLTLNTLNLSVFSLSSNSSLTASLGGTFAFTGAAKINVLGVHGLDYLFSAPIVLGSGATSLTIDGGGAPRPFNRSPA